MSVLYTLPVNRLPVFMPEEGEPSEIFSVRIDQWLSKNDHHPEERFVVLESLTGERYATTFPQEIALLGQVAFICSNGKNQVRSQFNPRTPGRINISHVEHVGREGRELLTVYNYLLYEQQAGGRWMIIEYDSKKLPQ